MLKIKLAPIGKKHQPHFRIVVVEENSKLTGRPTATLGHFHPLSKHLTYDRQAVTDWINKGAQPTARIRRLLKI